MVKDRIIGVDIAKILAMFLVVGGHVNVFGLPWGGCEPPPLCMKFIRNLCGAFFGASIDIFAIASGYLGIASSFKFFRILRLWGQVVFTGLAILSILMVLRVAEVTPLDWLKAVIPIAKDQYWYMTAYFMLLFTMPILNNGIKAMAERDLRGSILITLGVICGESFLCSACALGINGGYSFAWLMILYIVGAYIRLYQPFALVSKEVMFSAIFVAALVVAGMPLIMQSIVPDLPIGINRIFMFGGYTSPFTLVIATGVFLLCIRVDDVEHKFVKDIIATLSGATLGVYLIHMQPILFRDVIHPVIKKISVNTIVLYLLLLVVLTFVIYLICSILEFSRHCLKLFFRKLISLCK